MAGQQPDVGERLAPPQPQRAGVELAGRRHVGAGRGGLGLLRQGGKLGGVGSDVGSQPVTCPLVSDDAVAGAGPGRIELPPQRAQLGLHDGHRAGGRVFAPEQVDDRVPVHARGQVHRQQPEHGALAGRAQRDGRPVAPRHQSAQHAQPHPGPGYGSVP
jgi:hypothetical protein